MFLCLRACSIFFLLSAIVSKRQQITRRFACVFPQTTMMIARTLLTIINTTILLYGFRRKQRQINISQNTFPKLRESSAYIHNMHNKAFKQVGHEWRTSFLAKLEHETKTLKVFAVSKLTHQLFLRWYIGRRWWRRFNTIRLSKNHSKHAANVPFDLDLTTIL